MKKIIALFLVLFATVSSAVPLSTWPEWVTAQPFVSKQVPPGAMIARCEGENTYCVIEVDKTTGAIPVTAVVSIDYSGPTGDPVPADAAFIGGEDPSGDLIGVAVDAAGRLQIDAVTDNDFVGLTGAAVPTEAGYMAGINGTGDLTGLLVDAAGNLQIDVVSSALPTGAATEAKQDAEIALLTTIDADTSSIATDTATIAGDTTSIDAKTPALGQAVMAASVPVVVASDQTLTVALPTGAATAANQATMITELQQIEAAIGAGNVLEVQDKVNLNYSSTNVTTAAYVQIIASTAGAITAMTSFEGSGQGMILATGAAASEVDLLYIPPGGIDGQLSISIPAGVRLSIKAITATANVGLFIANFIGP